MDGLPEGLNSEARFAENVPMDDLRELTTRVRLLETKNHWLSRCTCLLLLALVGMLVIGQATAQKPAATQQDEVRAKRFVLVDDDGDRRAVLGFAPGLMVHGRSKPGFESAILSLLPKNNSGGIRLMVMHDGRSSVRFDDIVGKTRMGARLLPLGNPLVWFSDSDEKARLALSVEADGKPSILFKDKDGRETVFSP
jgi:hypothetical protein